MKKQLSVIVVLFIVGTILTLFQQKNKDED